MRLFRAKPDPNPKPDPDAWKRPAHPSAQVVARESIAALDRLLAQLDTLDLKVSFLAAASFALAAGFVTAMATKPPTESHLQDAAVVTLSFYVVTLAVVLYTWWPRSIDVPPHPRGLREHHWNDHEENVLRVIADQISVSYGNTMKVAERKTFGIKIAALSLAASTLASAAVIA